jgi:hypothetical protein
MKEFLKKNFALLLAFILPALLIIIVAITTYLPSAFIKTSYNFLYSVCTDGTGYYYPYNCDVYLKQRYSVVDGKILVKNVDLTQDLDKNGVADFKEKYSDRVFYHDTLKNESREIELKEAEALQLSGLLTSPDGITVSSHYNRGGGELFPFSGGYSSYGYYLTKGKSRTKINLINNGDQYYYQNNFQFIGWVLPGRN